VITFDEKANQRNFVSFNDYLTVTISHEDDSEVIEVFRTETKPLSAAVPNLIFFYLWRCGPTRVMASSFLRFLDHTQRRTTVGRTPLDE
jgi:hypothetical protein